MLKLGSARPRVAGQEDVSVELTVQVIGAEPPAVGHWDATVAAAGVHRGAHLAAWSITFHTATQHTGQAGLVCWVIFMRACTALCFSWRHVIDRKSELWYCRQGTNTSERIYSRSRSAASLFTLYNAENTLSHSQKLYVYSTGSWWEAILCLWINHEYQRTITEVHMTLSAAQSFNLRNIATLLRVIEACEAVPFILRSIRTNISLHRLDKPWQCLTRPRLNVNHISVHFLHTSQTVVITWEG